MLPLWLVLWLNEDDLHELRDIFNRVNIWTIYLSIKKSTAVLKKRHKLYIK